MVLRCSRCAARLMFACWCDESMLSGCILKMLTLNAGVAEELPERKKRRRPQVDYKALDEKLKAQEPESIQTSSGQGS